MLKKITLMSLCAILMLSCLATAVGASDVDINSLTGLDLLAAYDLTPYGADDDIAEAYIEDGRLIIKWGSTENYPKIFFNSDVVPLTMTSYTYSVDMTSVEDTTNKLNEMIYGQTEGNFGMFGFRTANYVEGNNWAAIYFKGMAVTPENYFFGQGDYASLTNDMGTTHHHEITVLSDGVNPATITAKIDNLPVPTTNDTVLSSSMIGFTGWKDYKIAIDNIVLKNNETGATILSIDFEDHPETEAPATEAPATEAPATDPATQKPPVSPVTGDNGLQLVIAVSAVLLLVAGVSLKTAKSSASHRRAS